MTITYEILQIMPPTPAWALAYRDDDRPGKYMFSPPLAFALVEMEWEDGEKKKYVSAIDSQGVVAEGATNYAGMAYLGDKMAQLNDLDELPPGCSIDI
ncbi:hypothetical protein [Roseospira goensis]|uniref:Uncharacterized protein n=1 Tax=Roseospira goensis TaxID=391922 RepID=A0A7W6S2S4_9PROT|nr:hypothetical protein [Roseospira goensis]MBB4287681.1 hypothetical protein [Roseospira goensis]